MKFITLNDLLSAIAIHDTTSITGGTPIPATDEIAIYSAAAVRLHNTLHHHLESAPKWMELAKDHGDNVWLTSEVAAKDGMSMLYHMAGAHARKQKEKSAHIAMCINSGHDPATIDIVSDPNTGLYDYARHPYMRDHEIGFEEKDIVRFLDEHGIASGIASDNTETAKPRTLPRTRHRQQEEAIISAIKSLNHDPEQMPRSRKGCRGIKSEVHKQIHSQEIFSAPRSFDKAWERLLREEIKYATNPTPPKLS